MLKDFRGIGIDKNNNLTNEIFYGFLVKDKEKNCFIQSFQENGELIINKVHKDYVAISFDDIEDSLKKTIYISLNKRGYGGDILQYEDWNLKPAVLSDGRAYLRGTDLYVRSYELGSLTVKGIMYSETQLDELNQEVKTNIKNLEDY